MSSDMAEHITARELRDLLETSEVVLVDLLTPEDFARRHIPGAHNACVYEVIFFERVAESVSGRTCPVVVYDATGATRTAVAAREKLLRAGYRRIVILKGGLRGWVEAGFPVDGVAAEGFADPRIRDGRYPIDTEISRVEWIGRNINNRHYGRISLAEGEVAFAGGSLTEGRFVLDMTSIVNLDLQDMAWNSMLVRHLMSEDFFEVERYPTATFVISGYEPVEGASPGTPSGVVTGELLLKGVTRSLRFPAIISSQGDGCIKSQAALELDRTLWNVCYGSGRLFERLGMHLVHDIVSLELFVVTK